MSENLLEKKCVPCEGGVEPLGEEAAREFLKEVSEWEIVEGGKKIRREFTFKDFKEAMHFVEKVSILAEDEGHHPDIHIFYNKVVLELWTHAIGGLSENDFIVAVKSDKLL